MCHIPKDQYDSCNCSVAIPDRRSTIVDGELLARLANENRVVRKSNNTIQPAHLLDGHYLAANTVFQNMVGYTEAELREFSFFDITYEEDRAAKLKLVRELVERNEIYGAPRSWAERNYHKLIYFHEVDKGGHFAAWEQPGLFSNEIRMAFRSLR